MKTYATLVIGDRNEQMSKFPDMPWRLGGRWSGYFKLKPGALSGENAKRTLFDELFGTPSPDEGFTDSALKYDIDFAGMREKASKEAGETWDKVVAELEKRGLPTTWTKYSGKEEDKEAYMAQPSVSAILGLFHGKLAPDMFLVPRDELVKDCTDGVLSPHRIVKDGVLYAPDEDTSQEHWTARCVELLADVPDTTRLSWGESADKTPEVEAALSGLTEALLGGGQRH